MAKLINSETVSRIVPKMIETSERFVINAQVYDKTTLEPQKFETFNFYANYDDSHMNTHAVPNIKRETGYFDDNNVIIDKYEPEYSYVLYIERNGHFRCCKIKTSDNKIQKVYETVYGASGNPSLVTYSQDVSYIYGLISVSNSQTYVFKITKATGYIELCNIFGALSQVTLLKDTPLFLYLAASRYNDRFCIIKYNKSLNSITTIYSDDGDNTSSYYSWTTPMVISENEVLVVRCNKTFNRNGIDNYVLKKYLIDYTFDKIYDKNVSLDCSILPKGMILRSETSTDWLHTIPFVSNNELYFTMFNRKEKILYVVKKISDTNYAVIQKYDLPLDYNGVLPYNDGKTMIFYTSTFIDFISFRELEEKFELTSTISGHFSSLCIDKNKIIWLQHADSSVEMIGLNVPTIAEALFIDTELYYTNENIESYIEVFCKNFDGKLVEADVEVNLNGPVYFTDTNSKKRKVRTSANNVLRIPVTINNSGYIEANTIIN